jgi:hypothetical protein
VRYFVYIDEYGNTGEPRYEKKKWNWDSQAIFALGSICVSEENLTGLKNDISGILHEYDNNLGDGNELKSKAKYKFTNPLMKSIVDVLNHYHARTFIDITNKRYKIVSYLVDYCVFPYYLYGEDFGNNVLRTLRVCAANCLYDVCPDDVLGEFISLCEGGIEGNKYSSFIAFVKKLQHMLETHNLESDIEDVIDTLENIDNRPLKKHNLIPIIDYTNKGTPNCFLPNIDAFLNTLSVVTANIHYQNDIVSIVHDEQKQFDKSIKGWTQKLKEGGGIRELPIENITFKSSHSDVLIQICDFTVGKIARLYEKIVNDESLTHKEIDFLNIVKPLVALRCNVVSTMKEQNDFFRGFDMIPVPTVPSYCDI